MEEGCLGVAKEGDNISCPIPTSLQNHVTAEAPRSGILLSPKPDDKGAYRIWSPPPGAEAKTFYILQEVDRAALDIWTAVWHSNGFATKLLRPCEEDPRAPINQCCYDCREYWGCSDYRLWVWKKDS